MWRLLARWLSGSCAPAKAVPKPVWTPPFKASKFRGAVQTNTRGTVMGASVVTDCCRPSDSQVRPVGRRLSACLSDRPPGGWSLIGGAVSSGVRPGAGHPVPDRPPGAVRPDRRGPSPCRRPFRRLGRRSPRWMCRRRSPCRWSRWSCRRSSR